MHNNHISYIEFKTKNLETTKKFYTDVFGWKFTDYGPTYTSFTESGIHGGFEYTDGDITNCTLVVLYHEHLEKIQQDIIDAGGIISVDIFDFPGGRRFQFLDHSGNELAVWSDK